jgi:uncharacterized protein YjbI with pentapeptide repeats
LFNTEAPHLDTIQWKLHRSLLSGDISYFSLEKEWIVGGSFQLTNLNYTDFSDGQMECVTFSQCAMEHSRLSRSSISSPHFFSSNLSGSNFDGARIEDGAFIDGCMDKTSFKYSIIARSFFKQNDLSKSDFSCSHIDDVAFIECNLSGANFQDSKLENIQFTNCWYFLGSPPYGIPECDLEKIEVRATEIQLMMARCQQHLEDSPSFFDSLNIREPGQE